MKRRSATLQPYTVYFQYSIENITETVQYLIERGKSSLFSVQFGCYHLVRFLQ